MIDISTNDCRAILKALRVLATYQHRMPTLREKNAARTAALISKKLERKLQKDDEEQNLLFRP